MEYYRGPLDGGRKHMTWKWCQLVQAFFFNDNNYKCYYSDRLHLYNIDMFTGWREEHITKKSFVNVSNEKHKMSKRKLGLKTDQNKRLDLDAPNL